MEIEQKCPIWGTPAKVNKRDDFFEVYSPRAGGKYQIVDLAKVALENESLEEEEEKIRLTDWLIEVRGEGLESIILRDDRVAFEIMAGGKGRAYIDSDVIEQIKYKPKQSMRERIDILVLFLSRKYEIGALIDIVDEDAVMMLMAHSSSSTDSEMLGCLRHCVSKGYLEEESKCNYLMAVGGKIHAEKIESNIYGKMMKNITFSHQ